MLLIEDHARAQHNMIVDATGKDKIRNAIKRDSAAAGD
jgi:predicted small metal-binding protein